MTPDEEKYYYERYRESNIRFIRGKLPAATPKQLALIAAFIRGFHISDISMDEYNRDI